MAKPEKSAAARKPEITKKALEQRGRERDRP
jgi:hypothetical protein